MKEESVKLVKIGEAAKILGVSIDTLRRWEKAGKIQTIRTPGSTRLYPLSELKKILPTSNIPTNSYTDTQNWRDILSSQDQNPVITNVPTVHLGGGTPKHLRGVTLHTALLVTIFILATLFISNKVLNLYQNHTPSFKQVGLGSNVLAESTIRGFLEVNGDVDIKGAATADTFNGLTLEDLDPSFSASNDNSSLTVTGTVTINQSVSTTSSPTFAALNLTDLLDLGSLASDPTTGNNGQTYYNTTSNKFRCYQNGAWKDCDTDTTGSGDITAVNIGNGLSGGGSSGDVTVSLDVTTSSTTSTTFANSGLELASDGLSLLRGCSDAQGVKWDATDVRWECGTFGVSVTTQEGGSTVSSTASTFNFTAADFILTDSPAGTTNISLDYTNAKITRADQNETITGTWSLTSPTINTSIVTGTTFTLAAAATTLNIGPSGASGSVAISGGSGDTGCTLDGTTGNLVCAGSITSGGGGTVGYWQRSGTTLSPATAGDIVSLTSAAAATSDELTTTLTGVGSDAIQINLTQSDDDDSTDNSAGLRLALTSSSADADLLYGIDIGDIVEGSATEVALRIGSGWTNLMEFEGATADGVETFIQITDPTSTDKTITFPNASGEVCLVAAGNCAGSGTGVTFTTSTANTLAKFTDTDGNITNSSITDDGSVVTFTTDIDLTFAAGENLSLTNSTASTDQLNLSVSGVTTDGADGIALAFTQADDGANADTNSALNIAVTSSSTSALDTLYGINMANITGGSAAETAINIGSGWDTDINATTSLEIGIGGANELTLTATALAPSTDSGQDLGTSSSQFADLFLDGGNITLDNLTDIDIDDALASSFTISEGANNFINIKTSATDDISFGNATTNPTFGFLGTGLITIAGAGAETNSLTLTTGTITLTDGDLTLSSGEIAATSDDATGTNFSFTTGALTTGTGLGITASAVMTTGAALSVSSATYVHTALNDTGNLVSLSFTDASTNANAGGITNGLNIASTINTTGAGTKNINAINIASPTKTACTTGACTWTGLAVADPGTLANATFYAATFAGGNVGIGTTTPIYALTFADGATVGGPTGQWKITDSGNGSLDIWASSTASIASIVVTGNGGQTYSAQTTSGANGDVFTFNNVPGDVAAGRYLMKVQTAGTTVAGIFSGGGGYFAGNVGIGTTAPDAALEINHATGDSLRLTYNDADGSATNFTDFSLSSTGALTITGSAASIASATGAEKTFLTLTPATITLTGTTQVTSQMDTYLLSRATIAGDTATVTVDDAATLTIDGPPAEGSNVALTEAYALKINTASSTAATTYGLYVDAPTGGTTANYGAYFASGNVNIQGLSASLGVYTDASKNLTSTIPTSGALGYWTRASTTLSPATANDIVSIANTNTTGADLAITNTGVYTGTGIFNLTANSATTGNIAVLSATAMTTGEILDLTGTWAPADGSTNEGIDINITHSPTTNPDNFRAIELNTASNTAVPGTTVYGLHNTVNLTGNAAKTGFGISSTITTSSTTADALLAIDAATSANGIITTGTRSVTGIRSQPISGAQSTGGTTNVYGLYSKASGDVGAGGTINNYGLYVANGTYDTDGTSAAYGIYLEDITGADTNIELAFASTSPTISVADGGTITITDGTNTLCSIADAGTTGNLTCTGNITGSSSGTAGFWSRTSTTLSPATANDIVSIANTNTTGADLAITNTGIYTGTGIVNITANSATGGDVLAVSATALTTGSLLVGTGPSSTGVTDHFVKLTSDIGSGAALIYGAPDFSGSAVTGYGINITGTDATANANTDYGYYGSLALTGNAAKTAYGIYSTVTTSSTTAENATGISALYAASDVTGIITTGTRNVYGLNSQPSAGAESTGGTTNVYGVYSKVTADVAAGGTVNAYGLYVDNGTFDTDGTSTGYGIYINTQSGADTNYGIFADVAVGEYAIALDSTAGIRTVPIIDINEDNTTGTVPTIQWDSAETRGGLLDANLTGALGTENFIDIDTTAAFASNLIDITTATAASSGNIIDLNFGNIADTGDAINISMGAAAVAAQSLVISTTAGIRTQSNIEITENNTSGTVASFKWSSGQTRGGFMDIDTSGAWTNENLIDITTGAQIWTANIFDINVGAAAATGDIFNIDLGATAPAVQALVVTTTSSTATDGVIDLNVSTGAGQSTDVIDITSTLGIMDGSDTFQAIDINLTGADHTSTSNVITGIDLALTTPDADATEKAINISANWDYAIQSAGGSVDITDSSNTVASLAVTNNTANTIGAAAAIGIVDYASTSLTTGTLLNLELTEGTLAGGYYLRAWDVTAGAAVFTVGEDGATSITGLEGSNMLTVTAGDAVISDGSLLITDDDDAVSFGVTNNTATTIGAGINTAGVVDISSTSLTTGNLVNLETTTTLTSGRMLNITSTSTALTTGNLLRLDWTPGSATTATGDLFSLNIGANGTTTGNLFNILDSSSSIFSVSETAFTTSLPTNFTAAGDVSIAYDIVMTNQTAAYINSNGPLTIRAGESSESNDLTLTTYNYGAVVVDTALSLDTQLVWTASDATPDVSAGSFFISGTSSTTVTDFDAGSGSLTPGHMIVVESNATNITFDCTSNAEFNCGVTTDPVAGPGDILMWIYDGTVWNLISWMDTSDTQTGADVAEYFPSTETLEPGDVVSIDETLPITIRKSNSSYDNRTLGIISTNPALELGTNEPGSYLVALVGRVPTKVSTENGNIVKGDYLTTSSVAGVAMKATRPGPTIGQALDDYSGAGTGSIEVFVNKNFADPNSALASLGLDGSTLTQNGDFAITGELTTPTINLSAGTFTSTSGSLAFQFAADLNGSDPTTFLIKNQAGQNIFSVDSSGNTKIAGTLTTDAGAFDIAEDYRTDENIEPGDLVSTSSVILSDSEGSPANAGTVTKTSSPYQNNIIGIVSTRPALHLGGEEGDYTSEVETRPIALSGRVPLKVSLENGPIEVGDYLTSSSTPGVAMKATRPGPTVGKALEEFNCSTSEESEPTSEVTGTGSSDGECHGKIMAFVNVSYADPGNFFASLSLDSDGNLIIPKIKTGSLSLDPNIIPTTSSSALSQGIQSPITNNQLTNNSYDISQKLAEMESRIKDLESKVANTSEVSPGSSEVDLAVEATPSAVLSEATSSGILNQVQDDDITNLHLTPPEELMATGSATISDLKVTDTLSSEKLLTALDATISGALKVFGETTLAKTNVAGDLTVDGTFSITDGSKINAFPTLYIQDSALAENVDFFNGLVTIDHEGKLVAEEIQAKQFSVTENGSAGKGTIIKGQTDVIIENTFVKEDSVILITPTTLTSQNLTVTTKVDGGFLIEIPAPELTDINFDYLIIGQGKKVSSN